jgi:hypothetical protein
MSITRRNRSYSKTIRWLAWTATAYALISLSPLGLHRLIMGRKDWWHLPLSYAGLVAGGVVWIATGRHPFAVVCLLGGGSWFFYLVVRDLATAWAWHWPFNRTVGEVFDTLDQRFNLRANLAFSTILAIAMWWLARIA